MNIAHNEDNARCWPNSRRIEN